MNDPGFNKWTLQLSIVPREHGLMLVSEHDAKIKDLTRERDEALNLRDQYETRMDAAERGYDEMRVDCDNARCKAASPEVMRVIDALPGWLAAEHAEGTQYAGRYGSICYAEPRVQALYDAAIALSASRQPKAQEPRYWVDCESPLVYVRDRRRDKHFWLVAYDGDADVDAKARAEAECTRLNGEGGGR